MHSKLILLIIMLALVGCSSGVVPAGPDTYMVSHSVSGFSTAGAAKASAYREASAWCAARGLVMVPISSDEQNPVTGQHMGHAELTFRALPANDPEIVRPKLSIDPAQRSVIEVRSR